MRGKQYLAHRLAYMWLKGPIPEGQAIDHTCHEPTCVNPDHLRAATNKQNAENRRGAQANSKSGVRGVCWDKPSGKWRGQLQQGGKNVFVGLFDTIEAASYAVTTKRNELFTHNDLDRSTQ